LAAQSAAVSVSAPEAIFIIMASGSDTLGKLKDIRSQLKRCLEVDLNWSLYPETIKKVSIKNFYCPLMSVT